MTFTSIHTAAFSLPPLLRQKRILQIPDIYRIRRGSVFAKSSESTYRLEIVSAGFSTQLRKAMW